MEQTIPGIDDAEVNERGEGEGVGREVQVKKEWTMEECRNHACAGGKLGRRGGVSSALDWTQPLGRVRGAKESPTIL